MIIYRILIAYNVLYDVQPVPGIPVQMLSNVILVQILLKDKAREPKIVLAMMVHMILIKGLMETA